VHIDSIQRTKAHENQKLTLTLKLHWEWSSMAAMKWHPDSKEV